MENISVKLTPQSPLRVNVAEKPTLYVKSAFTGDITIDRLTKDTNVVVLRPDGGLTIPAGPGLVFDRNDTSINVGMGFHIRSGEGIALEPVDLSDLENPITRGWYFSTDGSLLVPTPNMQQYGTIKVSNLTSPGVDWTFPDASGTLAVLNDLGEGNITIGSVSGLQGALDLKSDLSGADFTGNITATNLSGTNTGDQTITLTGDVTGSGTGSFAATLKDVGSAGTYNDAATAITPFTTDAKGRVTSTGLPVTITPNWSSITDTPTTIGGYGITDAVTLSGDQVINGVKDFESVPLVPNLTPESSSNSVVNKAYVDDIAAGIHVHTEVHVILKNTTLTLATGGTVTYDNGTNGVGAKLTVTGGIPIVDALNAECGFDPDLTIDSRVVIADETNMAWNGIYTISATRELTRATDFDTAIDMSGGDFVFVTHGTTYADTGWICSEPVIDVGIDPVIFVQFSGSGTYDAGDGLQRDGTIFSVKGSAGRIAVSALGVDLANAGTAGTYQKVTTDAYGRVTSGTNPTTLSGYGITDAAALSGAAFTGAVSSTDTITGTNLVYSGGNTNATALTIGTTDANSLIFNTNNTAKMTILSNGNVGIGTATPTAKLDVADTTLSGSDSLAGAALNVTQTWNTTGTPTAVKVNVTDTASNAGSLLVDIQVGGVSKFKVSKTGSVTSTDDVYVNANRLSTEAFAIAMAIAL